MSVVEDAAMNRRTSGLTRYRPGRREGFTLIELAIVLIIAGILASFAVPSFQNVQKNKAAQNARDAFVWMAARARATAVERGTSYLLEVNPATERAWVVMRRTSGLAQASDTIQTVNFSNEFNSTISTAANTTITLCYNTRAYAWRCNASQSPTGNTDVTFTHGNKTAVARVKELGQIERL